MPFVVRSHMHENGVDYPIGTVLPDSIGAAFLSDHHDKLTRTDHHDTLCASHEDDFGMCEHAAHPWNQNPVPSSTFPKPIYPPMSATVTAGPPE